MKKRCWLWGLCLGAILLGILGYDRSLVIDWVGATDLEIEFAVTDLGTSQPIEGARIAVLSEGGFYREHEEKEFTLVTDQAGRARRVCHENMCTGVGSRLGFTDTYHVYLPEWLFQVSATGYEPRELVELHVPEYSRRVQRIGPGRAKLVVELSLRKVPT